ncbi:winged helix DNA-binding domain-containing protein [Candidatus Amarolinea aalborgensis]|uniref:winged helix DNA-binding domain-containing protein n=1 Tax=Candidatus Amarolinea aalborgensis TaxID=2249329 RepID=UPI003BF987FF
MPAPNRIALARLANQGIAQPTFAEAGDVVAWLGALQAQDYGGTLWAIGLRMAGATERRIEQAIAERTIVRTWPMRGTLHFVAANDVRWMLALLAPREIAGSAGRSRQLELDEATFARSQEVFAKVLQGGKQLTRAEMLQALEQAGIATTGQRGYHLLVHSAQDGLICFGSRRGKQHTFALLDDWIPPAQPLARDEALTELTRRYFSGHGPATAQDLMRWAGLTAAEVKRGLEAVGKELIQETIAGRVYWMPSSTPAPSRDTQSAYLLPGFDEYVLGYGDRSAVLDPVYAQRICPGDNGMFIPTLVIDGEVRGTWKRTLRKNAVVIEAAPFRPLTTGENHALDAAAQRYGEFLGVPVVLPHTSSP